MFDNVLINFGSSGRFSIYCRAPGTTAVRSLQNAWICPDGQNCETLGMTRVERMMPGRAFSGFLAKNFFTPTSPPGIPQNPALPGECPAKQTR